jgi:glycosyltransferase involved in cell wall biosynthesis
MIRILHITPDFNYSCGRSKLVYLYLKYFSSHPDYDVHFITNGGDSLERLKEIPELNIQRINFSTGVKNILYIVKFYSDLKTYTIKNKIDIIHTHHRFPEMIAVKLSRKFNLNTVFSTHGFVRGNKKSSFKSDKIISVSNSISKYLIEHFGVPRLKIQMLYNPIELFTSEENNITTRFKEENQIKPNQKVILYVGRFHTDKGYDTVIKSFNIISSRRNDLVLIMNGKFKNNMKLVKSIKNKDALIFIEPQLSINYLYQVADVVVLPSRSDSFPYVMLEAGIHKKPFIGGNTGGIAEFIEDGINGLLVDPENPQVLAEKIIYLLNNPQIGRTMGEKLYEKVNRLCDYNSYFSEVEKIYNSLITS